jgi:hypothetical protein
VITLSLFVVIPQDAFTTHDVSQAVLERMD